jgi:hypothetical protein
VNWCLACGSTAAPTPVIARIGEKVEWGVHFLTGVSDLRGFGQIGNRPDISGMRESPAP